MRSRQRLTTLNVTCLDRILHRVLSIACSTLIAAVMLSHRTMICGLRPLVQCKLQSRSHVKRHFLKASSQSHRGSSSNNDLTQSDSTTFVGKVVETNHLGRTQQGIVRNVKRGGWFSIQLSRQYEIQSHNINIQEHPQPSPLFNGDFIHKRFKDISFPSTASATMSIHDESSLSMHPSISKDTQPAQTVIDELTLSSLGPVPPTMIHLDRLIDSNKTNIPAHDYPDNKDDQNYYLQQLSYFSSFCKWIVFSDLHCSASTLSTCLEVLKTVFQHAQQRNAGVIFLGDFWHHRGTIRVDCLNAILNLFRTVWDRQNVPLIMIPGNHDQVTWQGLEHGLTPLQNAFFLRSSEKDTSNMLLPGVLVFTHPTIFKQALFIPHIRDIVTVQSVLQSVHPNFQQVPKTCHASDIHNSLSVDSILCHADVTGALMNDHIISTGGIAPAYFPPHIPVYSGHFHKPQFVEISKDISIRYVGSPYQVSLSEAGESKFLLVLDSDQGWACVEEIPLDIGRKHFKVSSVEEFQSLSFEKSSRDQTLVRGSHENLTIHVKAGDRVVVTIQQTELEEMKRMESNFNTDMLPWMHGNTTTSNLKIQNSNGTKLQQFEEKIKYLRAAGISVEMRELKNLPNYPMVNLASIEDPFRQSTSFDSQKEALTESWFSLEELSPMSTLSSFLYHEVERGAISNQTATSLLDSGKELIEDMEKESHKSLSNFASQAQSFNRDKTHLCLESVTIQGFGPFQGAVTYPLINRGLVLLRGSNNDGGSFDRYVSFTVNLNHPLVLFQLSTIPSHFR